MSSGATTEPTVVCRQCEGDADVLVMRSKSISAPAFAYCNEHDPDPEEYGNRTTWADKLVIRRFDEPVPDYNIYGRPGASESYSGRVMHIENPAGNGILCGHDVSDRRRFKLSHIFPEGYTPCGQCLSRGKWEGEFNQGVVGKFVYSLRQVLNEAGELPDRARWYIDYRTPTPRCCHALTEGLDCGMVGKEVLQS